jgi:hypothetical protein
MNASKEAGYESRNIDAKNSTTAIAEIEQSGLPRGDTSSDHYVNQLEPRVVDADKLKNFNPAIHELKQHKLSDKVYDFDTQKPGNLFFFGSANELLDDSGPNSKKPEFVKVVQHRDDILLVSTIASNLLLASRYVKRHFTSPDKFEEVKQVLGLVISISSL